MECSIFTIMHLHTSKNNSTKCNILLYLAAEYLIKQSLNRNIPEKIKDWLVSAVLAVQGPLTSTLNVTQPVKTSECWSPSYAKYLSVLRYTI